MSEAESTAVGQGLLYEDSLPLQWRPLAEGPALTEVVRQNEFNEQVMGFIGVVDEHPAEVTDEHAPFMQELARVESKLNLLLGLVGQLVAVHFPLPPLRAVRLSPVGVTWIADEALHPGDFGLVEIYLSLRCPHPLTFFGKVDRVEAAAGGYRVNVQFVEMGEMLRGHLEKIIFRHHRRRVALARRRASSETGTVSIGQKR